MSDRVFSVVVVCSYKGNEGEPPVVTDRREIYVRARYRRCAADLAIEFAENNSRGSHHLLGVEWRSVAPVVFPLELPAK